VPSAEKRAVVAGVLAVVGVQFVSSSDRLCCPSCPTACAALTHPIIGADGMGSRRVPPRLAAQVILGFIFTAFREEVPRSKKD
jgi:hypothetical protein